MLRPMDVRVGGGGKGDRAGRAFSAMHVERSKTVTASFDFKNLTVYSRSLRSSPFLGVFRKTVPISGSHSTFELPSAMESGGERSLDAAVAKPSADFEKKGSDLEASASARTGSGARKSGGSRDTGHSILYSVNKSTSQIKKNLHRRSASPLNWFPRKKTDSFLKRKIKHLQEIEGMNLSLDETLGNANPHYTRIAREKIAAQEAARKAMEARRAALIEASWCRILWAARIRSKEAEARLEKAEKCAAEAFEAARAMGVMMYDRPDRQRRQWEVETSLAIGGGRSTHKVTTSFETAFEVDKEVAAAVKRAFVRLANWPSSSNKEEFKDLLCRISQNPDANGSMEDLPEKFSECETDQDSHISRDAVKKHAARITQRKQKNSLLPTVGGSSSSSSSTSPTRLIDSMLDRLTGLHEDELASLAVIVATRGLNAALRETESSKENDVVEPIGSCTCTLKKEALAEVPSLDKFLVKHVSRLEREVQEARRSNAEIDKRRTSDTRVVESKIRNKNETQSESSLDLGSDIVKHVSELGKVKDGRTVEQQNIEAESQTGKRNRGGDSTLETMGLDKILVKPIHRLEKEKMRSVEQRRDEVAPRDHKKQGADVDAPESLDMILVKHVSRLEKEKLTVAANEGTRSAKGNNQQRARDCAEGLDEILVKHQSELEKAKLAAARQPADYVKHEARREARERELQEAWGGLSLGNSLRPHVSRIERDKVSIVASRSNAFFVCEP
ncbi:hypothetical protein MUK42_04583 [Musa troglodytarum]|uniref:Uncharacterized protein n=1 Tax=Musa troglodytarum TaxID=320322 RepID=A0A9E7GFV9_9LILI|nr:hypothetical protein MUK42_04583 [Musa troglodytarum]